MNHEHCWTSIEGNSENTRNWIIPEIKARGKMIKGCRHELEVLHYPGGPLQFQLLRDKKTCSLLAAYPYCNEGWRNRVQIDDICRHQMDAGPLFQVLLAAVPQSIFLARLPLFGVG